MASELFTIAGIGGLVDTPLGDAYAGFTQGFVIELVDSRRPAALDTFTFVLNPTRYELSEPFQVELTPTEDDSVISEETGIILRELVIEGTFGLQQRKGTAATLGGNEWFTRLRGLFRQYGEIKKDPSRSPFVHLVLHALKDDDHFEVVPREFSGPRDAKTARVHRTYRIRMTAIAGPKFNPTGFGQGARTKNFFDRVADISKALQDARAFFADATADLATLRRRVANIDALLIQTAGVVTAVGNFVRGVRTTFIETPIQLVSQTALALETIADNIDSVLSPDPDKFTADRDLVQTVRGLSASLDQIAQFPEAFAPPDSFAGTSASLTAGQPTSSLKAWFTLQRLTPDDLASHTAGATVGTKTQTVLGSDQDGGLDLGQFSGVQQWTVRRSDSVQSIANATSSTPEAIVLLNDLRYPFISEGGGPGIAKPGDAILVPSLAGVADVGAAASPSKTDYFTTEDALYGTDLALDQDALSRRGELEIKVDLAHGAGDCELVSGVPNVVQGIAIILNTEYGRTSHVPTVGIRRPVGEKGTMAHLLTSAVRLRDGILADDRVEAIESISTTLDLDVLSQEVTPRLVGNRAISLVVPFGKASGAGANTAR